MLDKRPIFQSLHPSSINWKNQGEKQILSQLIGSVLYRSVPLTRPISTYSIFGLSSAFTVPLSVAPGAAAAPHRPGLRSRALPRPSTFPRGPCRRLPSPGRTSGLNSRPPSQSQRKTRAHTDTGSMTPGNSGRGGLPPPPPAPRAGGRGPSAARLRRMRGPVPPRRRAERWGGGAGDARGSWVLLWRSCDFSGSPLRHAPRLCSPAPLSAIPLPSEGIRPSEPAARTAQGALRAAAPCLLQWVCSALLSIRSDS